MANILLVKSPSQYAHAENIVPVILKVDLSTAETETINLVVLRIEASFNNQIEEFSLSTTHVNGIANFDIASALRYCFEKIEQYTAATSNHIFLKEEGYTFSYQLHATLYTSAGKFADEEILSADKNKWYAIRAGVSDTVFVSGFDIFSNKHFSPTSNYFLTSRTADFALSVRTHECKRFWFLSSNNELFTFRNIHNQTVTAGFANSELSCFAIDLDQVRQKFYYTYGHLPNIIDIERKGFTTITYAIVPSEGTKHLRVLEFKNAYDVWDSVELTGTMELDQLVEGETYNKFHPGTLGFYTAVDRGSGTLSIKGSIGYKTSSELMWLSDMLLSPEVFLVDSGSRYPVVVKRDTHPLAVDTFSPKSFDIDITFAIKDKRYTPVR